MDKKIDSVIDALNKGKIVANPEAWKKGQITTNILTAALASIFVALRAFGVEIPITDEQTTTIASCILGIAGMYNAFATTVTTTKIGT